MLVTNKMIGDKPDIGDNRYKYRVKSETHITQKLKDRAAGRLNDDTPVKNYEKFLAKLKDGHGRKIN